MFLGKHIYCPNGYSRAREAESNLIAPPKYRSRLFFGTVFFFLPRRNDLLRSFQAFIDNFRADSSLFELFHARRPRFPNDTCYERAIASLSLPLWLSKMLLLSKNKEFAEVLGPRIMANMLNGMLSILGRHYCAAEGEKTIGSRSNSSWRKTRPFSDRFRPNP